MEASDSSGSDKQGIGESHPQTDLERYFPEEWNGGERQPWESMEGRQMNQAWIIGDKRERKTPL